VLTQVSSTLAEQRLLKEQRARRTCLQAMRQFVERLRSDDAWSTLYARLHAQALLARTPGLDATLLDDGREAFPPSAYYADYVAAPGTEGARVLVEVPAAPLATDPLGPEVLREDVAQPVFGLPADLNGDGTIDGASRNADYAVLPLLVTWRWAPVGEAARDEHVVLWLRGNR
jgi:hypothetical protein